MENVDTISIDLPVSSRWLLLFPDDATTLLSNVLEPLTRSFVSTEFFSEDKDL